MVILYIFIFQIKKKNIYIAKSSFLVQRSVFFFWVYNVIYTTLIYIYKLYTNLYTN